MSAEQTARSPQTPQTTPDEKTQSERLDAIAQRVATDARRDPQAYRRESRVPAGGE